MGWRGWLIIVAACSAVALGLVIGWPAPSSTTWLSRPVDAQPMIVENVMSGDTVILVSAGPGPHVQSTGLVTARLLAVDAPNFGITDECFAQEAQAKLASLLPEGTIAWVSIDQVEQDQGGRYFMYVWSAEGRFVNYELTLGGFARAMEMDAQLERWQAIAGGQESATGRLRGIWGNCVA